ncbi:MAG: hypothetical protein WD646_06500 [Actinomycetota bacterium]
MRTEEELRSRADHPAGKVLASSEITIEPPKTAESPYRAFLEALEDLENAKQLHGSGSIEATMSRARVKQSRERAIDEWRREKSAA